MFNDRQDAARQLAAKLGRYRDRDPVILALPRGGVPIGYTIAEALDAPLDLLMVRKIGAPWQPELAVAAIVDGETGETVVNEDIVRMISLPDDYIEKESRKELAEIERRRKAYVGDRGAAAVRGRTAIIVDDGIATGATTRAALRAVRRRDPAHLVLAVPVAPPDTVKRLEPEVDDLVCLSTPADFGAISVFYRDFHQVSDAEVVELLEKAGAREKGRK